MRHSLRARLTLAFAFIILVTLFLAGSAFVLILREYQIRREVNRVAELTAPLSNQVRSLEQLGATTQEIVAYLERQAEDLDLRVVLADGRGLVFADSEDTLLGRQLTIQGPARFGLQRRVRQATVLGPEGEISFMVSPAINPANPQAPSTSTPPPPGASVGERFLGRASAYIVGLSIPRQHSLATAWLELLPNLSLAALGALLLSIAIAWPLAASIARPLAVMTHAAEGIAQGKLDQQIPVRGRDEVSRLAQAFNRMAREVAVSQRTLRDFLANVSHDLRTPLTSIQGFSQALADGTLVDRAEAVEAARIVNHEAARMSQLVDDLLYLSKMETGQAPLQLRDLELAPLVAARIEAAAWRAAEAGVELVWLPEPVPPVEADPLPLERVVDNLLDNALRHSPRGRTVTVRLTTDNGRKTTDEGRRTKDEGPRGGQEASFVLRPSSSVTLSVHNTGSTIPPEDLPRVFERFYQVDKARAAGSSGLGLAISREIVLAHGGRCWAESSGEQGTTFFVLLPGKQSAVSLAKDRARAVADKPARVGDPLKTPRRVISVGSAKKA
jgi:signal transduction histidine kinase